MKSTSLNDLNRRKKTPPGVSSGYSASEKRSRAALDDASANGSLRSRLDVIHARGSQLLVARGCPRGGGGRASQCLDPPNVLHASGDSVHSPSASEAASPPAGTAKSALHPSLKLPSKGWFLKLKMREIFLETPTNHGFCGTLDDASANGSLRSRLDVIHARGSQLLVSRGCPRGGGSRPSQCLDPPNVLHASGDFICRASPCSFHLPVQLLACFLQSS